MTNLGEKLKNALGQRGQRVETPEEIGIEFPLHSPAPENLGQS